MEKNVCTEDSCISVINFAFFDWSDIVKLCMLEI